MKLLVMSDSHKNLSFMQYALANTEHDAIIHLGDHIGDAKKLSQEHPDTSFYMVMGNCDYQKEGENELFITLEDKNILITHGHLYDVKNGFTRLVERSRILRADLVLYGHTHKASLRYEYDCRFMCPGQIQRNDIIGKASYGIVTIENGQIGCELMDIPESI